MVSGGVHILQFNQRDPFISLRQICWPKCLPVLSHRPFVLPIHHPYSGCKSCKLCGYGNNVDQQDDKWFCCCWDEILCRGRLFGESEKSSRLIWGVELRRCQPQQHHHPRITSLLKASLGSEECACSGGISGIMGGGIQFRSLVYQNNCIK